MRTHDDDMQHIAIIEEDAFHRLAHDSERALWSKPLRSANFLCMDLQHQVMDIFVLESRIHFDFLAGILEIKISS